MIITNYTSAYGSYVKPSNKREQMIMRLLNKFHDDLVRKKREYSARLDTMSDAQIEKEYKMEFGE